MSIPLFFTIIISLLALANAQDVKFEYHGGSLLNKQTPINICLVWYGDFTPKDKATVNNFFASFNPGSVKEQPGVSTWWRTTSSYKDKAGKPVSIQVKVVNQFDDAYSLGKDLKRAQIGDYVRTKIASKTLPLYSNGVYLVLTAKDVKVERFCQGSCGFHDSFQVGRHRRIVYSQVGESSVQCPGLCAWPYAVPSFGPPGKALVAPNGVAADGLVMNIATVLAGAATNPFRTGYFQGDVSASLEAVTACPGIFGAGAYPGYPGDLKVDTQNKSSYNTFGVSGSKFLLPAIWDLISSQCKVHFTGNIASDKLTGV